MALGFAAWTLLDPKWRRGLAQGALKLSEKLVIKARELFDEYSDRVLLAIKEGIEEAKKTEEELGRKLASEEAVQE
jgi:hypothetical protein